MIQTNMTNNYKIFKALLISSIVLSMCFDYTEQREIRRQKRQFQFDNSLEFLPPPPQPGGELIFSNNGRNNVLPTPATETAAAAPTADATVPSPLPTATTATTPRNNAQWVFINNRPRVATMAPFTGARTTPTPQFLSCFAGCLTTPQYNPICASNMELYLNEGKFNCAVQCGANIQIVRRGSCEGLFPMSRG